MGTVVGVIDGQRCGGYGIGDVPRYLIAGPDRFQCPGTAKESPYFGQGAFPLDDFIFQGWQQLPINLRKSVEPYYNTMDENQVRMFFDNQANGSKLNPAWVKPIGKTSLKQLKSPSVRRRL